MIVRIFRTQESRTENTVTNFTCESKGLSETTRILHSARVLRHFGHSRVSFFRLRRGRRCSVLKWLGEDDRSFGARDLLVSSMMPKVFASTFEIHLFLFGRVSTDLPLITLTDFSVCTYWLKSDGFQLYAILHRCKGGSNRSAGKDCMGPIAPSERVSSQLAAFGANVKLSNLEYLI